MLLRTALRRRRSRLTFEYGMQHGQDHQGEGGVAGADTVQLMRDHPCFPIELALLGQVSSAYERA